MGQLLKEAIFSSFYVVEVYPNILHEEGLTSLRKLLDARTEIKVTTKTWVELAEIVLKYNIFQFNEKKSICNYIYGWPWEKDYGRHRTLQPHIWWRYIDDIFFVWEHGEGSLKQFIEALNADHPIIKFSLERSKEEINVLDVNVILRNRQFETDLHIKPTDTHQFLDSTFSHPYHCEKRLYSNYLEKWVMQRGYNERMVSTQIIKARGVSRDSHLERRNTRPSESKITFNTTYSPAFQNVRSILEELLNFPCTR